MFSMDTQININVKSINSVGFNLYEKNRKTENIKKKMKRVKRQDIEFQRKGNRWDYFSDNVTVTKSFEEGKDQRS